MIIINNDFSEFAVSANQIKKAKQPQIPSYPITLKDVIVLEPVTKDGLDGTVVCFCYNKNR